MPTLTIPSLPTLGGALVAPDAALRRFSPRWCPSPGCFPGYRCMTCGDPSGQHSECRRCHSDSLEDEARYVRAVDR